MGDLVHLDTEPEPNELVPLLQRIGWSQSFFAKHIGVDPHTVSRWCRECPPMVVVLYLELLLKQMNIK